MDMISLRHIDKRYGAHRTLEDVNLTIGKEEIYGLVGKNGAGKTTIFKIILGLTQCDAGVLSIAGSQSRAGLTARENLEYYRQMKGIADGGEVERVLRCVGLQDATAKFGAFSMGMKQRLGIANAMMGNPEILILDEPVNGLDPQGIADVRSLIVRLNAEQGTTVVVSSHILGELEHIFASIPTDRYRAAIGFADSGELRGHPIAGSRIIRHDIILSAYLQHVLEMFVLIRVAPSAQGKLVAAVTALFGNPAEILQGHVRLFDEHTALIAANSRLGT